MGAFIHVSNHSNQREDFVVDMVQIKQIADESIYLEGVCTPEKLAPGGISSFGFANAPDGEILLRVRLTKDAL